MENRRTESARAHDDRALIESLTGEEPAPHFEGRAGGGMQADIATRAELDRVRDPAKHEGVTKRKKLVHGEETPTRHRPDMTP